ncbi:unnamed protein product [Gongylonema pulchrum]|uniref:NUP50 domain-containing protein n=1 Tax=Gongylonema pulchrum TaxID=637853 RepID=A0A183EEB7_9BILA|nr:unnamed protein product [Gongylonema pulchrum]
MEKSLAEKLFLEKMAILNRTFVHFIECSVKEMPDADLSPSVRDYLKHVEHLDRTYGAALASSADSSTNSRKIATLPATGTNSRGDSSNTNTSSKPSLFGLPTAKEDAKTPSGDCSSLADDQAGDTTSPARSATAALAGDSSASVKGSAAASGTAAAFTGGISAPAWNTTALAGDTAEQTKGAGTPAGISRLSNTPFGGAKNTPVVPAAAAGCTLTGNTNKSTAGGTSTPAGSAAANIPKFSFGSSDSSPATADSG